MYVRRPRNRCANKTVTRITLEWARIRQRGTGRMCVAFSIVVHTHQGVKFICFPIRCRIFGESSLTGCCRSSLCALGAKSLFVSRVGWFFKSNRYIFSILTSKAFFDIRNFICVLYDGNRESYVPGRQCDWLPRRWSRLADRSLWNPGPGRQ